MSLLIPSETTKVSWRRACSVGVCLFLLKVVKSSEMISLFPAKDTVTVLWSIYMCTCKNSYRFYEIRGGIVFVFP